MAATPTLEPERPRCRVIDVSMPSQVQRFALSIHGHSDDDHVHGFGGLDSFAPTPGRPPDVRLLPQMVELEASSTDPYYSIGYDDGRYQAGIYDGLYGVDEDERGLHGCDDDDEYDDGGGYTDDYQYDDYDDHEYDEYNDDE